ncbi:MAG TPA: hypothetical protein VJG64_03995 [Candidatus Paceibacterota bacterium]
MAHDDMRLKGDEDNEDLLLDTAVADIEDDDDDKNDPLMAGDEEPEEKDWM